MARLVTAGFEGGHEHVDGAFRSVGTSGSVAPSTTRKRSGDYALRVASGATSATNYAYWPLSVQADATVRYYRFALWLEFLPTTATHIMQARSNAFSSTVFSVTLDTAGVARLFDGTNTVPTSTITLATGQWYVFELAHTYSAGGLGTITWAVDGAVLADAVSFDDGSRGPDQLRLGYATTAPGTNQTVWFDDVAVNDNSGSDENTAPPRTGKIVTLLPASISAKGVWTGGAGGTVDANMLTAVTTRPPAGTATETNTSQIESAGTGAADAITFVTSTYTAAGITADDTIRLVCAVIEDGEDATTGTKTGSLRLSANPTDAGAATYEAGDNVGPLGTYPDSWAAHKSSPVSAPTVDLGTGAALVITDTDVANRVQSVCFAAVMVEYVPSTGPVIILARPQVLVMG